MSDVRDSPEEPTGDSLGRDSIFPEQEEELIEVTPRRPVTARGIVIVGARTVAGIVGLGVAAAAIAASTFLPLPTIGSTAPSQVVTPVPTAQQLVCPGAILRLADDTGEGATTVSAIGEPLLRFASSSGPVDSAPMQQSDAATGGTGAAPTIISTPPDQADPTEQVLLSGAQAEQLNEGDFVGLGAGDCAVATGDSWLAGGSTVVGRTTLLTLSNPSEVPATVNVQLFGESGPISAPGTSGIIVPANGQRVLSLAGFEPDVVSPVVHVSSTGGRIVAGLQQAIVRGLVPGGVDIVEAIASPTTDTVIPGLLVTDLAATQALRGGGAGFEDVDTVLRVFAPGEGSVSLTVNVIPEDGANTGTSFQLDIDAGRVTDIPVQELATGSYTVRIESNKPVVAAARVTSVAGGATDFAWLPATLPLTGRAQFTVAGGPSPVLHLVNPGTSAASVTLTAMGGADLAVQVAAGASAIVPVDPGATYTLSGFETLYGAITLAADGMIARYAVHPPGAGSTPVTVYP